jgi:hypothetical protein
MIKCTNYLERKYAWPDLNNIDPNLIDIMTAPKHNLMGISIGNNFLMLNVKHFFSFRLKLQNIGFLKPFMLLKFKYPIDKDYLTEYFDYNQDNPYAMQNVMNCIGSGKVPLNLTQFPPLFIKKDDNVPKIEQMYRDAELGDCIFTFDRGSGISRLIRKYDKGMWSHVGVINKDKKIVEMTTSGISATDFSSLCRVDLDVGLYRLKDVQLSQSGKKKMQAFMDESLKKQIRFNWKGIFLVFLHKKYGIPIKYAPTPADLIYSNKLELISYA